MASERELQEAVARCLATMAYYHSAGRGSESTDFMESELRQVFLWASRILPGPEVVRSITGPVGEGLSVRYGRDVAAGLKDQFLRAFRPDDQVGRGNRSTRAGREGGSPANPGVRP